MHSIVCGLLLVLQSDIHKYACGKALRRAVLLLSFRFSLACLYTVFNYTPSCHHKPSFISLLNKRQGFEDKECISTFFLANMNRFLRYVSFIQASRTFGVQCVSSMYGKKNANQIVLVFGSFVTAGLWGFFVWLVWVFLGGDLFFKNKYKEI